MTKLYLVVILLIMQIVPVFASQEAELTNEVTVLEWLDLIPKNERNRFKELSTQSIDHTSNAAKQLVAGGVRPELNGRHIKIAGFVIPLEGDNDVLTDFLLVPFYGACIHVPPPPLNQIIYVRFENGASAPVQELWDIVYITGILKAETLITYDLDVESGYSMKGIVLEVYNDI
ncbi:DUF3299 domain-containing protein [Vibrio mediterranei]|uniref:DUF3299 domain-containing protein n=1 Tax=Vibrio mediterranei TaxID=689 RepID=UPI0038CE98F6